jgi:hypothetical protein
MNRNFLSGRNAFVAALRKAFGNNDRRESVRRERWRNELTEMLEADLTNLDSLIRGFSRR